MPDTKAIEKTTRRTGIQNQTESINPALVCKSYTKPKGQLFEKYGIKKKQILQISSHMNVSLAT